MIRLLIRLSNFVADMFGWLSRRCEELERRTRRCSRCGRVAYYSPPCTHPVEVPADGVLYRRGRFTVRVMPDDHPLMKAGTVIGGPWYRGSKGTGHDTGDAKRDRP